MLFDLHSHTTVSDGKLTPVDLVARALDKGVDVLSITDHDTADAYEQLTPPPGGKIKLLPGIEFSTQWQNRGIHVLGLNITLQNDAIREGIRCQREARLARAARIAEKLEKFGIKDALPAVEKLAGSSYVGRPHFAQHLVNVGAVRDIGQAFKKYLGPGKPGDVKRHWAPLVQIIEWIRGAGGTAVLAHPLKYKLTRIRLLTLIDDFIAAGGQGIEVISGQQTPDVTQKLAKFCTDKNLLASCGSDFHEPGQPWRELGRFSPLPKTLTPVWESWN
ncbi:MAG: PHP domain-containing protein [Gammaproteobacteria bacterium]|nr:PHP domain-containing protein [Gammaproteobacteria bacterium]